MSIQKRGKEILDKLTLDIENLFVHLSNSNTYPNAILEKLIEHYKQLDYFFEEDAKEYIELQEKLGQIRAKSADLDNKKAVMVDALLKQKEYLKDLIFYSKIKYDLMKQAKENPLDADTLLSYARKISYTTSAPGNWNPQIPLKQFKPPCPTEFMLRQTLLFQKMAPLTKETEKKPAKEDAVMHSRTITPLNISSILSTPMPDDTEDDIIDLDLNP